jgi:iron complex outermembrane recepter protein
MKRLILLFVVLVLSFSSTYAQKGKIVGTVRDAVTGETLPGANVVYGDGKGTTADINGAYSISTDYGDYDLTVSFVGYTVQKKSVKVSGTAQIIDFLMSTITLSEVNVVGDVAKSRETPVAFTNVLPAKIQEELGSQDLPMILNTTPGVYATQQGGGDGDSRINIRGFSQRNVAVMIDGIPVNDMENSWVYWSNWFGLDAVTRSIQVQRGLGASKLAIPSVGGTMNIITKGITTSKEYSLKQEVGSDGYLRTSAMINTGKLKGGWGVTFAGSYKYSDGWVDKTWSKGWFYYLKIDKTLGKHILSITGSGAPQSHAQRPYKKSIATYSIDKARDMGVDSFPSKYYGLGEDYNQYWGYLERYTYDDNKNIVHADKEVLNSSVNYFHKPQITLRDFWNASDKVYMSNIAYVSMGSGGGVSPKTTITDGNLDAFGQVDWQKFYDANVGPYSINPVYDSTEHMSSMILKSARNDHFWYGLLSTVNWKISQAFDFAGGIDLRSYKGSHYTQLYDLIGGDYYHESVSTSSGDKNSDPKRKLHVGDKMSYNYDGIVRWGGAFANIEFKGGNFSAFINLSGAYSGYKKIDYFMKKGIMVGDSLIEVGYNDTVEYLGTTYTRDSPGLENRHSDWKWIPSYTIKGGLNYNLTEEMNIFINLGYLTKARDFKYIYEQNSVDLIDDIKNEAVMAAELGYNLNFHRIAANLNGYYTTWKNKAINPIRTQVDGDDVTGIVPGIDARHMGVELEFSWKIIPKLELQGLVSYGDWIWTSKVDGLILYDDVTNVARDTISFDAKGVHVDDAAQSQYAASLRYEPFKGGYIKGQFTYFDRYFSTFDPASLNGEPNSLDENGDPRDSWKIPAYFLIDVHAGYSFKIKKVKYSLRLSVLNLLNNMYISDATNNDSYNSPAFQDFDAKSASVFYGLGRRYTAGFEVSF